MLLVASFALAAALTYWWAARVFSNFLAPLSAIAFLSFIPPDNVLLTNTSLAILPAAVFHSGLSHIAAGSAGLWPVITGLALFCCVEANASCLVMLPILLAVSTVSATRPLAVTARTVASIAVPALALSSTSWTNNLSVRGELGLPIVGATLVLVTFAWILRPSWARIPTIHRQQLILIGCVVGFAGAAWVMVQQFGWVFHNRYLAVILPAISVLPAAAFSALRGAAISLRKRRTEEPHTWITPDRRQVGAISRRRWAFAWIFALSMRVISWSLALSFVDQIGHPPMTVATFRESEVMAAALKARGWSYFELQQILHGQNVLGPLGLLVGLSLYMEPQNQPPTMTLATHLRILRVPAAQSHSIVNENPGWDAIDLPDKRVALISSIQGWVRPRPAQVFVDGRPWSPPAAPGAAVNLEEQIPLPNQMFEVEQLAGFGVPHDASSIWIDLPIDTGEETGERVVTMLSPNWVIVGVEGVEHDPISPDATSVVLRSAQQHHGTIRLAVRRDPSSWLSPVEFIETLPDEVSVRARLSTPSS